jgi:hypothetical protein
MVVDALYFNRVQCTPLWYTPSGDTMVVEVKYVLWIGLQLQPISATFAPPNVCTRLMAIQKKAIRVSTLDHKAIMEEATMHDKLEYKEENEDESSEDSKESKKS